VPHVFAVFVSRAHQKQNQEQTQAFDAVLNTLDSELEPRREHGSPTLLQETFSLNQVQVACCRPPKVAEGAVTM